MASIFISYAREDQETAEKIHDSLVSEGHSVWMDCKKLVPGQDWKMEIEKAIQSSDIFIACLSTNSIGKQGYVQKELKSALEVAELMPEGRIFIIPVRLDECEVPFKLKGLHWVNYFEIGSGESLFRAVRTRSNVEKELEAAVTDFLIRNSPENIPGRFAGVSPLKLSKALLTIAKKKDELASARKRAVRGLILLKTLDAAAWSEILPTASMDMLQEWLPIWGDDADTTVLNADHIRMICEGKHLPKASIGFGKAVRKFISRGAGYTSSVLLPASKYPAWEVKLDCVKTIIRLDDADSIKTLGAFSTMSYFVARTNIIEYVEKKFDAGALSQEDLRIAIDIADRFVNDGKTKPKTPTLRKSKELLVKLTKENHSP
jgi:hypothetical protein